MRVKKLGKDNSEQLANDLVVVFCAENRGVALVARYLLQWLLPRLPRDFAFVSRRSRLSSASVVVEHRTNLVLVGPRYNENWTAKLPWRLSMVTGFRVTYLKMRT